MSYEKKDDTPFDQFLNLSGSSSNVNSPVISQAPQGYFLHGAYQQQQQSSLSRPVPGFKADYNLKKASSKTDLREDQLNVQQIEVPLIQPPQHYQQQSPQPQPQQQAHVSQEDVTLFLDELNSLTSPSQALGFNNQFESSIGGSPQYMAAPMIISTPPQEDSSVSNHNPKDLMNTNVEMSFNDFLQPDFHGNAFQQQRLQPDALSDLASSVSNSPFLEAYSPSAYDDDLNGSQQFLDYSLSMNGNSNDVDLLSAQLDMRLTEDNLHQHTQSPVTISISTAPEDSEIKKTPSLFSSNQSSRNNTPHHSRAGSNSSQYKAGHFAKTLNDDSDLLKPDDLHSQMRTGRQRRQSRSRSRSASKERDRSLSANREKMLELASPNGNTKRTQKHPSIYACHLCEKRFTRPYNLKSHLRTHTDERPFVCTVCGKAFARQHDRKRHEDLHSGEKRYECRGLLRDGATPWGCGKKFARTDALGRHFKTEAGKECIRPLVEEHENELRQKAADEGTQFTSYDMNTLPEQLYMQFPGLMQPSHDNSGVSDLSDIE